jgi:hypothetical protein
VVTHLDLIRCRVLLHTKHVIVALYIVTNRVLISLRSRLVRAHGKRESRKLPARESRALVFQARRVTSFDHSSSPDVTLYLQSTHSNMTDFFGRNGLAAPAGLSSLPDTMDSILIRQPFSRHGSEETSHYEAGQERTRPRQRAGAHERVSTTQKCKCITHTDLNFQKANEKCFEKCTPSFLATSRQHTN